jgi:hypothetical protein
MPDYHQNQDPDQDQKDTSGPALPWTFVLDPAANARALGDVQRRGARAAQELIERVMATLDGPGRLKRNGPFSVRPTPPSSPSVGSNGTVGGLPSADLVNQLVQGWWELTTKVLSGFGNTRSGETDDFVAPHDDSLVVNLHGGSVAVPWRIEADTKGQVRSGAELWFQNSSPDPLTPIHLSVSDLLAESGSRIPSSCVGLDPSRIKKLPARSARGVLLELHPDEPIAPGKYRGIVATEGARAMLVPIEVEVHANRTGLADRSSEPSPDARTKPS